jgi:hypothetical protein
MGLIDKVSDKLNLRGRIDSLAPRERQLLTVLLGVFGVLVLLVIPIAVSTILGSKRGDIEHMRLAIDRILEERGKIESIQQDNEAILTKYKNPAPALAGFLHKLAEQTSLEIPEIKDRPAVPHGKSYEERSVDLSMKKVGMYNLLKFLEAIAQSPHPLGVHKLQIRKRGSQADSYNVDLTVSAYHRLTEAKQEGG